MRLLEHLEPGERLGEVLFGLIMVLTFTLGAGFNAAEGREGVHELLIATLGCNFAWGLIDGVLYMTSQVLERARITRLARAVQQAKDRDSALAVIETELEPRVAGFTNPASRARLYDDALGVISRLEIEPVRIRKQDLYGGIASFWLVFATALPAVVPFLLLSDPRVALRTSNALLIGTLFLVGQRWARFAGGSRLGTGLAMMSVGLVLVGVAMALGG